MHKKLIINADDYGQDTGFGVCDGILWGFHQGVITSTTVLVDYVTPQQIKNLKVFKIPHGLHVVNDVEREIGKMCDIGLNQIDHLDSHRFEMYKPDKRKGFYESAKDRFIPIRRAAVPIEAENGPFKLEFNQIPMPEEVWTTDHAIFDHIESLDQALEMLRTLKDGITELMVHVSLSIETPKEQAMHKQLSILTSKAFKRELLEQEIELVSWQDV